MRQQILEKFIETYGSQGGEPRVFFSPGRVNLIGEHIDYNGGLVFPCALTLGTYGAIRKRDDNMVRLVSGNVTQPIEFTLDNLQHDPDHSWGNYVKGVIVQFMEAGYKVGGFDMYIYGNLPNGAGLSSSASLNTLVALAIDSLFGFGVDPVTRVKMCQKAEHYNGVNCGIMDPFACAMGEKDHAILLDCATLEYRQIPLELGDYRILIANTNYKRGLADSKYNERLAECKAALADLQTVCDIEELCDLSPEEFEQYKGAIKDDTNRKRAEHAVYENYRTKEMANALSAGRLDELFVYMEESHESLRDLYDVVGDALDAMVMPMVDYARLHSNPARVLGTRMTGAGFGGCTVSIVHKDYANDIIDYVGKAYYEKTGTEGSFYMAEVADGAREI
ncbi:MAG: galactokinase [Defluviitaleaceae bacterium]|nr:galactokinase [Defluviitaleaceae bacterium]